MRGGSQRKFLLRPTDAARADRETGERPISGRAASRAAAEDGVASPRGTDIRHGYDRGMN